MLTPDPSSNDGHGRYPATDSTAALERDAFIIGLKQRLPEELRESFTDQQLEGLRSAFATRSWARHKIDLRGTFSLWSNQYYFVLVGGRNKRSLSRAQRNLSLAAKAGAITLDGVRSVAEYERFVDVIEQMVVNRVFSREDQDVPSRDALLSSAYRMRGLPRPLLAVLLGQAKMHAYEVTLASAFPDSEIGVPLLTGYFTELMKGRYADAFTRHPLAREIVATVGINRVVNHAGITFLPTVAAQTEAEYGAIVQAYVEAEAAIGADRRRAETLAGGGLDAASERRQLLAIEQELEEAVLSRLTPATTR